MKIYLAGPLFSQAERDWQVELKEAIFELAIEKRKSVEIILPFELIDDKVAKEMGAKAKYFIAKNCLEQLVKADMVVANLDDTQVDDGTAWEIGHYHALYGNKNIIGIRTDSRNAGETRESTVNAMIEFSCSAIAGDIDELRELLGKFF
jgi:nucleoside 2-deoxyribosyltransferase